MAASRKRKKSAADLFSPEAATARLTAKKKVSAEIDSHVDFFRSIDLNAVDNIKEDQALV